MNLETLIPMAAALCTFIVGVMIFVMQNMRSQLPDAQIRQRMRADFGIDEKSSKKRVTEEEVLFTLEKETSGWKRWIEPKLERLATVSGKTGMRIIIGVVILVVLESIISAQLLPVPTWAKWLGILTEAPIAVVITYKKLVDRFRKRFLDAFPDAIDTIVRAVRAGVPVTHAIETVCADAPDPLRTEFRLMADSLHVGRDINETLEAAARRIEIPDFSFFCVCLNLQRETGGQLGETLENLAGIIRTRREIRQKTKALTGEARVTVKILAAIPVVVMALLFFLNHDYVMVLIDTQAGHKLMTFAGFSIVFGVALINKMSKLETSR